MCRDKLRQRHAVISLLQHWPLNPVLSMPQLRISASTVSFVCFQLAVNLWDSGRTEKTSTAMFMANITRNEFQPVWNTTDYQVTINDRYTLGQTVIQVGATDRDLVCYNISQECEFPCTSCITQSEQLKHFCTVMIINALVIIWWIREYIHIFGVMISIWLSDDSSYGPHECHEVVKFSSLNQTETMQWY